MKKLLFSLFLFLNISNIAFIDDIKQNNIFDVSELLKFAYLELEHKKAENAIEYLKQAQDLDPDNGSVLNELGKAYMLNEQFENSFETCIKMHKLKSHNPKILCNMAYLCLLMGCPSYSLKFYNKAIELEADNFEAQLGLGFCYLTLGNFEKGWHYYQARFKRNNRIINSQSPLWQGQSLDNKSILLIAEQGLGDTIQFIRFAQLLKQKYNCTVKAALQPALVSLITSLFPSIDSVRSYESEYEEHDYYIPMLSLPLVLNINDEKSIPYSYRYLKADNTLKDYWKSSISNNTYNIGICWQANPSYINLFEYAAAMRKSMPINYFSPLSNIPGVKLYSLQKNTSTEINTTQASFSFHTFDGDFDNSHGRFMDTAAIIENLDLIITIDTSIAHLAGALGKEVWVILPEPADWRWMLNRTDTPWYANMRLFKQKNRGDWTTVMQEVKEELERRIRHILI